MMKNKLRNTALLISFLVSYSAVFLAPQWMMYAVSETEMNKMTIIETILSIFFILLFGILVFHMKATERKNVFFSKAAVRFLVTLCMLILMVFTLSLFNGVISVMLYAILKVIYPIEKIKKCIQWIATVFMLLTFPIFVSVFWTQTELNDSVIKNLLAGIRISGKKYFMLEVLSFVAVGLGMFITTICSIIPSKLTGKIAECIIFGLIGAFYLILSENFCRKDFRGKK